ncbi:MAG: response regulator [Bacteroidia bacterium]|nr:response regulator [Bacteroidia bacterium]
MSKELKTIIVEDELRGRNALKALLRSIPLVNLVGEAANVEEAKWLIETKKPDLILLDIEMPYKSGFDLLAELPEHNFDVIFTTAYDSYAIKAIKFSAIDYLLKPIDPEELAIALHKTFQKRNNQSYKPQNQINDLLEKLSSINKQSFKISLPTTDGTLFIAIDEIVRCQSFANYTSFFILHEQNPIIVAKTLKDYEELLQDYGFCRVHNSHLINLKFVKKYIKGEGGIAVMTDGFEVEVSRRKKEIFQVSMEKFASIL